MYYPNISNNTPGLNDNKQSPSSKNVKKDDGGYTHYDWTFINQDHNNDHDDDNDD